VLQCVAACCSVLQRVAVCCSVLQCVAVCCSHLSYRDIFFFEDLMQGTGLSLECVGVCWSMCCNALQRVAACCCVLLRVAECCKELQCVAVVSPYARH